MIIRDHKLCSMSIQTGLVGFQVKKIAFITVVVVIIIINVPHVLVYIYWYITCVMIVDAIQYLCGSSSMGCDTHYQ